MSAPQFEIVNTFKFYRIWAGFLVFVAFMLIDFLAYGVFFKSQPYEQDLLHKGIWTLILAFAFTAVYNQGATWHADGQATKFTGNKIKNSIIFSAIIGLMFIAVIACSCYLVSAVFIYVLDGFRGIPEDIVDDGIVVLQTVTGGLVLEYHGKDQTEERRNG